MFISFFIILILSLSGLCLTYLFADDKSFLWRLSAGNIIGSAIFGLIAFFIANFFGLSIITVLIALIISLAPLLLLRNKARKRLVKEDWQHGKDKTQGASFKRLWRVAYYLFFLVLFIAFFDRAMIVGGDGIFTGASQNLGDLPYHLGAIFSFTDGNNFPPQNPSFSDAKFTYPFIADFLTACLVKLGANVQSAMLIQNVLWAFSLLVIFERFVFQLTNSRLAGKIAPFILFFSGGFGFLWFFKDYWYGAQSFWEILWNLPRDYTISDKFRWGNSLVVLFVTQRSLLLGLPLTVIVLNYLWGIFSSKDSDPVLENVSSVNEFKFYFPSILVGIFAGMLPLIHAHSLAVLFVVTACLFFFSIANWKKWIAFGIGVCVFAVPELIWILSGSASRTSEFIGWHYGWHSQGQNLALFWLKNTGIFIPLLVASIASIYLLRSQNDKKEETDEKETKSNEVTFSKFLLFFVPFLLIFIVSNAVKFAPWEWDNIKILIYWFIGSIPFVAFILAWMWQRSTVLKAASIACIITLTLAGALDVWRTASAQMKNGVFDSEAVKIAEKIKLRTEPNALFLNAPTYNSAIALSGRRSLMRYVGHLSSHGIDYKPREDDLKRIYAGEGSADVLLKKYGIEYVLISPKERESLTVNEKYFEKFDFVAEEGKYIVYKVK